jgi:hypothetical protein
MNGRILSRLAWVLWALGLLILICGYVLDNLNGYRDSPLAVGNVPGFVGLTVGALIVSRRPSNRIGWLFLWSPLLLAFGGSGNLADQYALYTFVTRPGALPAGVLVVLLGLITQIAGFLPLVTFLPLLFPDGRPPSPRWRPVAWLTAFQIAFFIFGGIFSPRLNNGPVDIANPLAIEMVGAVSDQAFFLSLVLSVAIVLLSVASVFVRFRRASGDERQQLKWFGFGALPIPISLVAGGIAGVFNVTWLANLPLWQLSVAGIPIVVGIAIFKYRLYDIDLIIRRTLVYAALTALLALIYFGSVLLLEQLLRALTGQQQSEIVIVLSTLVIAGLFTPLRGRIQQVIDRRFYRKKYDAQQVLSAFGASVRDEVDLNRLTGELLGVVEETMQPSTLNLWLRESKTNRK